MQPSDWNDELVKRRMAELYKKPFEPWCRKLIGNILRMYCSTLDADVLAQKFEHFVLTFEGAPLSLAERARLQGHFTAFYDFIQSSESPEHAHLKGKVPETLKMIAEMFGPFEELKFEERKVFHQEFAHAYERTIEPNGNGFRATEATGIYVAIAVHSLAWLWL